MIPWLSEDSAFPRVELALSSPNGLLAAGGELSAARLLEAYRRGIFPWFNPGEPILWWSPDPRMVLIPSEFKISRSLDKVLRNVAYEVRTDTVFERVMRSCAAPRQGHHGTWIHEEMIAAYCELHRLGYAHSVEVWMPQKLFPLQIEGEARRSAAIGEGGGQRSNADELELELVGGLYGICIGRMFYGESMFSSVSNASKIALAHLAWQLDRWQFPMIDCQMNTSHLASLGAREIPRSEFIATLQELVHCAPITEWKFDRDLFR
ncbi:MAG: leucyl/phenylalanyl-tRNA--protein transferase [Nitrosomonadales bacterium]|nr:leucyl/phenylalanyl-tRNA--protein transferase [Nitrosomonadales bacterium]